MLSILLVLCPAEAKLASLKLAHSLIEVGAELTLASAPFLTRKQSKSCFYHRCQMLNNDVVSPVGHQARLVPTIAPYRLPGDDARLGNRVSWTLEPKRAALLVHDMQQYWIDRFVDSKPLIASCSSILRAARLASMPIVYTVARSQAPKDRGLAYDLWGAGIGGECENSLGEEVVLELAPLPGDLIIEKRKYSAFFETELGELLQARKINQLVIVGVYAHHGILVSAVDAYMRDIAPFFVVDATADHSEEQHRMACDLVPSLCGQNVTSAEVLAAMRV